MSGIRPACLPLPTSPLLPCHLGPFHNSLPSPPPFPARPGCQGERERLGVSHFHRDTPPPLSCLSGLDVTVYERDLEFSDRKQGYGLTLINNPKVITAQMLGSK